MTKIKQNTIAMVYDFDETLSPKAMQEYSFLDDIGSSVAGFWSEVQKESKKQNADPMLTYMRLMVQNAGRAGKSFSKDKLKKMGKDIEYFPGVENYWFDAINAYVKEKSGGKVKVKHYIISAGNNEILEGVSIANKFEKIFASEYFFDVNGVASFVNRVVNDTAKTQYLFRISKGVEDTSESVNEHMEEKDRPVPFKNMMYFGDGDSDVPSMTVTGKNGGFAVAVYPSGTSKKAKNKKNNCKKLLDGNRVDFCTKADYSEGSDLEVNTKLVVDKIIADVMYCESIEKLKLK